LLLFVTCVIFCLWLSCRVANLTQECHELRNEMRIRQAKVVSLLESLTYQQAALHNIVLDSREIRSTIEMIQQYNEGRVEPYQGVRWTKPLKRPQTYGVGGGSDERLVPVGRR
jgi:hypothetical protein